MTLFRANYPFSKYLAVLIFLEKFFARNGPSTCCLITAATRLATFDIAIVIAYGHRPPQKLLRTTRAGAFWGLSAPKRAENPNSGAPGSAFALESRKNSETGAPEGGFAPEAV